MSEQAMGREEFGKIIQKIHDYGYPWKHELNYALAYVDALREELANLKQQWDATKDKWNPIYKIVCDERDKLREELAQVKAERDDWRDSYQGTFAELCEVQERLDKMREESLDRIACHQREIAGWEASVQQLQARLAELEGQP